MKLYYSSASPFVRKVLVTAHECGLADRIDTVATKVVPTEPNREYGRVAPLMKLPSLERDDGGMLFDSIVICEYLDSLSKGAKVFPPSGDARWKALRMHALADGILEAAVLCRYETAVRPAELRWNAWLDGQMLKIDQALDMLEHEAAELDRIDIGTITAGCALGYLDFRFADRQWRKQRPRLARWYDESMSRRPSFEKTAPKA